ncbi:MAG TPA: copper oxidase, partial [Euryarchaeota archaeon]|nr:copper oxidase [Euryarchaeota archaeon]
MNSIKYAAVNIIETLLRGFPIPCKTGLVKIGDPDRKSPVFL